MRAKGHGSAWARFDAAPARTTDVRVPLPETGAVEGTASPGGLLRAERTDLPADFAVLFERTGLSAATTQADAGGRFRLEDLPPGRYRVSLGTMRAEGWHEIAGRDVDVPAGGMASVALVAAD